MITRNLSEALKASVVPALLLFVILGVMSYLMGGAMLMPMQVDTAAGMSGMFFVYTMVSIAAYLFVACWIAVTWHRFVLLEEYPATLPAVSDRNIGAYAWQSVKIGLAMVGVAMIMGVLFALTVLPLMSAGSVTATLVYTLVIGLVIGYISLRVSVCLPAVAVGKQMGIRDSWTVTAKVSGAIFALAVLLAVFNLILTFPAVYITWPPLALIYDLITTWIVLMVGVSVLTTLYGNLVEGRELAT